MGRRINNGPSAWADAHIRVSRRRTNWKYNSETHRKREKEMRKRRWIDDARYRHADDEQRITGRKEQLERANYKKTTGTDRTTTLAMHQPSFEQEAETKRKKKVTSNTAKRPDTLAPSLCITTHFLSPHPPLPHKPHHTTTTGTIPAAGGPQDMYVACHAPSWQRFSPAKAAAKSHDNDATPAEKKKEESRKEMTKTLEDRTLLKSREPPQDEPLSSRLRKPCLLASETFLSADPPVLLLFWCTPQDFLFFFFFPHSPSLLCLPKSCSETRGPAGSDLAHPLPLSSSPLHPFFSGCTHV